MTRLKYERKARRWSQTAVARKTELNQATVSMIERGVLVPTAAQLSRLSEAFGVAGGELLKEVVILAPLVQANQSQVAE